MTYFALVSIPVRPWVRGTALATALGLGVGLSGPLAAPLHAQGYCEDVSGVYDVLVDLPGGGPTQIELDIEQTECEVKGFVGAQTRSPIDNGVVEGSTASFTFEAANQGSGGMLVIRWEVTIDGDDVTGTFSHELFGSIEVVGTRAGSGDPPGTQSGQAR